MNKTISYKRTIYACYIGNFIQAAIVNVTPILFVPLRNLWGLSYEQMGRLVLVNFVTQFLVDLIASKPADKYGVRASIILAHILAAVGIIIFSFSPLLFKNPYTGFLVGTIIFSGSGGLFELLLSPIISGIPSDEKEAAMSFLHSFYAWGQVVVVLTTTILISILGEKSWNIIMLMWVILPILNCFLFAKAPFGEKIPDSKRTRLKDLVKDKFFIICICVIFFGGASELVIGQWSSTFIDKALKLPKIVGDTLGVCMFAAALGTGRVLYGKFSQKISIHRVMLYGSVLTCVCFLTIALSPWPIISLLACCLSGLGVSMLWPGSVLLASGKFPLAGFSMFALLSASGDGGAAFGPWVVGIIADIFQNWNYTIFNHEEMALRVAIFISTIFPLMMFFFLIYMKNKKMLNK